MELIKVQDINIDTIASTQYDISIFACGYEQRATELAKRTNASNIKTKLTLHFSDHKYMGNRPENDSFFKQYNCDNIEIGAYDEEKIYSYLREYILTNKMKSLRILVDYTCMSRLWYTSIINWARYSDLESICVDFSYTIGAYKEELNPLVIKNIHALPGHEGITTNSNTISVFGLGFDSLSTLCVLDKLEPSKIHSFVAIPVHEKYTNKAEEYNKEFIENYSEPIQYYPLTSLEKTYRLMSELIMPYRGEYNISFVPMGPKPHVLASILLSTKYDEIINLYVKGDRNLPPNVVPSGGFICTRVFFNYAK